MGDVLIHSLRIYFEIGSRYCPNTPQGGYKYLAGKCTHIISKYIPQFLVYYGRDS